MTFSCVVMRRRYLRAGSSRTGGMLRKIPYDPRNPQYLREFLNGDQRYDDIYRECHEVTKYSKGFTKYDVFVCGVFIAAGIAAICTYVYTSRDCSGIYRHSGSKGCQNTSDTISFLLSCFSALSVLSVLLCFRDPKKPNIVKALNLQDEKNPVDVAALLRADSGSVLEMAPFVCKIARHRGITPADILHQQDAGEFLALHSALT